MLSIKNHTANQLHEIRFIIFLLLICSLPFVIKISNSLLILSTLLSLANYLLKSRGADTSIKLFFFIGVYFLIEIFGLLYTQSENMDTGFSLLETQLPFILVPVSFMYFDISYKSRNKFFYFLIVSFFIASLICLIKNIQLSLIEGVFFHGYYFSHDRLSEPIGMQAVYFALYLSICALFILHFLKEKYHSISPAIRVMLILLFLYFLIFIVASGARTVIVALLVLTVVSLIVYAIQRKSIVILILSAFIPLVFVVLILTNPVVAVRFKDLRHSSTQHSNYDSYFARLNIWVPGIEAIKENFLIGVGTGDQQQELSKKFEEYGYQAGIDFQFNMHNQYLQTMLGSGIVGFIVLILIFLIQFVKGIKEKDLFYLSFLFLFTFACLTESMLHRNKGILFFLIFSFIFFKSRKELNPQ